MQSSPPYSVHVTIKAQPKSMQIPLQLIVPSHTMKAVDTHALIDSRADISCIDYQFTKKNHLPLTRLATPTLIRNADLSENKQGIIKYSCHLFLNIEGIIHDITFHVMSCGKESLILGLPWLRTINPKIDWHEKTISIPGSTDQSKSLHNLYTYDTNRHHQWLPKSPISQPHEVMVNQVLDHHLFSYLHHESENQFLERALDNQAIFHLLRCGN